MISGLCSLVSSADFDATSDGSDAQMKRCTQLFSLPLAVCNAQDGGDRTQDV